MAVCNDSSILYDEKTKIVSSAGLPTESSLKVLNEKISNYD